MEGRKGRTRGNEKGGRKKEIDKVFLEILT